MGCPPNCDKCGRLIEDECRSYHPGCAGKAFADTDAVMADKCGVILRQALDNPLMFGSHADLVTFAQGVLAVRHAMLRVHDKPSVAETMLRAIRGVTGWGSSPSPRWNELPLKTVQDVIADTAMYLGVRARP